ncbi:hypothetical protein MIND_00275600 [Mycena indigotica]|uniref:Uncharacterized protein n=1 Tax=Mycena indigotica TaxID=2126181 RepID=A0A8H6T810_9AGAR|nr:uncharacterized protein MIND_00275600 [Mycena indigotica]KAF7312615.1 hypothetical protein MIND_00275600 [Mycena indigotica]
MAEQIVLVTGANKGIGFEIVRQIASKGGYRVLLGARDAERGRQAASKLEAEGLPVAFLQLDVDSDASIAAAVKSISVQFGRLDVLVNNAGISLDTLDPSQPIMPSRDTFDKTFATNTTGAAMLTEALVPLLSNALTGKPNVVFVSSDTGSLGLLADPEGRWKGMPLYFVSYRCSKAALNMLAVVYAARFKEKGWRVNIDNPGYTATEINGNTGGQSVQEGAKNAVRLATLGVQEDLCGTYSEIKGALPW